MRRSTFTIVVCLLFSIATVAANCYANQDNIDVIINRPDITGPTFAAAAYLPETPLIYEPAAARSRFSGSATGHFSPGKMPVKCKAPVCPPTGVCMPKPAPSCILPRRMPGQWELATQVFFARTKGTARWPAQVFGIPATEMDFNDDLGIPSHQVLLEYSGAFQFRPHWAVFYSIMPIRLEGSTTANRTLYFGQSIVPFGTPITTRWDFLYQRVGLLYQPIVTCNATVSIYSAWLFNDQKLQIGDAICAFSSCPRLDRTRNMVMSGIEVQKCIRTFCNGGTFSCDNRVGLGYLDGTFALDVQVGFRFSVPMNCGRWGFARGGYRLLNFTEDRNDLRLDAFFDGGFVEGGLIF